MKKLIRFAFILISLFLTTNLSAQWVLINEGGGNPDGSAALEVTATDRGFLMPRMSAANRLAIPTPQEGLLVYQTDGLPGFYYYNGAAWDTLRGTTVTSLVTTVNNSRVAIVKDIKGVGIDGGTFTAGAWQTRDLNTLEGDTSFITIDGISTFTLDSGVYEIGVTAPANGVDEHQCRLYNVTDATAEASGTTVFSSASSPSSILNTVISISSSTTFRIEHQCEVTVTNSGFGEDASWGNNVYTQVRVQKLN
ncbi:MAG: hypothetical protein CMP59_07030 [Flavobacteriales bacterium]|nr:hypothetical protein [Flavobacteriales bacterium]|tara:strand:- start:551 stop:1303 length:753 start_codon:yes stop_codon:yes gene_type:complete